MGGVRVSKLPVFFLLLCMLLMALPPAAQGKSTHFHSDVLVYYSTTPSSMPRIALSTDTGLPYDDYMHIVWEEQQPDGTYEIYYRRARRSGYEWSPAYPLTKPDGVDSKFPVIAAKGSIIIVAWQDKREADQWEIFCKYSLDNGESWSEATPVTALGAGTPASSRPEIAIGEGYAYIAHMETGGVIGDNWEVAVKRAPLSDLSDWDSVFYSGDDDIDSVYPTVAASGSYVYVAWLDKKWEDRYEIFFKRSSNEGTTWSSEQQLTSCEGTTGYPRLAAYGQYVHLVWHDDCGSDELETWYKRSTDYGATWSASTRMTTPDAYSSAYPSIDVGSSTVAIVWRDLKDGNREIYCRYSFDNGETWLDEERLTHEGHDSYFPDVAVSGSFIAIAWVDMRSGDRDIYCKTGSLWDGFDMTYVLFRYGTYLVCGHWERPDGSQVIPAATSDTAGAGAVGLGLGYYGIWDVVARFDSDVVDPVTLEWKDTTHNLIVFGGPIVNSVSKKFEGTLGIGFTENPDGTWTVTVADLGSFDYDPANMGQEDLIILILLKDNGRYILFIMGLTPYGTLAGSQLVRRFLNPWSPDMMDLVHARKAVVRWQATVPNQVNPGDTWTVLAAYIPESP